MTPQPAAPQKKSAWTAVLIVLAIGGGCCVVGGGVMAAIAIPNFVKYQARSKQSECKSTLRMLYTAERSLFAEKDLYSENPEETAFVPEARRFVYVMSRAGAPIGTVPNAAELAAAARSHVHAPLGVDGKCPDCTFTAACAGNVDQDPEIDVWSVSTADRPGPNGTIPAGEIFHDFDDVTDSPGR